MGRIVIDVLAGLLGTDPEPAMTGDFLDRLLLALILVLGVVCIEVLIVALFYTAPL